jgi:site-specific DNA-methyltransferase (adenine-specific)
MNKRSKTSVAIGVVETHLIDTVQLTDCVAGMKKLPDNSVDIVIADPPYNASKGNLWKWDNSVKLPGFGGDWATIMADWDDMPLAEYFSFTLAWLAEVNRIVRPTGSIWVHGTFHNIGIVNLAMQLLKIEIINEVVWFKRNSFPNLSGRRLTASHESILWAHTGGKKRQYFFDYETSKQLSWSGVVPKETGKQMRTVWDIPNNKDRREIAFGKHPAQKPLRLLKRMLEISAKPGQLLVVPFAGAGSECVAAKELGLHFLGFEEDSEYFNIIEERLKQSSPDLLHQTSVSSTAFQEPVTQKTPTKSGRGTAIPSIIKWTGSKRSQARIIAQNIPDHRRYYEPFLGSGAMLYLIGKPGSVAGDIYSPLIELWQLIQNDPESIVEDYQKNWTALQNDLPGHFYTVRDRFNERPNPLDLNFLTRTCVNGIIRFNRDGKFNNSFHLSRKGMEPERFRKIVETWHDVVHGVNVVCQDYASTISDATKDDFVYFDPPYAGNFARYTNNLDLDRFFEELEKLNHRGVKWALSFDGERGGTDLSHPVPESLFERRLLIPSGNSAVSKVLNGPIEPVHESLYMNY